jgi:hypothetical protein
MWRRPACRLWPPQQFLLDQACENTAQLATDGQTFTVRHLARVGDTPYQTPTGAPDHRSGLSGRHTEGYPDIGMVYRIRRDGIWLPRGDIVAAFAEGTENLRRWVRRIDILERDLAHRRRLATQ